MEKENIKTIKTVFTDINNQASKILDMSDFKMSLAMQSDNVKLFVIHKPTQSVKVDMTITSDYEIRSEYEFVEWIKSNSFTDKIINILTVELV